MDNFLFVPRALAAGGFDIAFAVLVGAILARLWLDASDAAPSLSPILRRTSIAASAVLLSILPIQLWLTTATMVGSSSFAAVTPQLYDVLTGTHAGRVLVPAYLFAAALFAISLAAKRLPGAVRRMLPLALALGLTAVRAASGHAASDGDFTLTEVVQFFHLAGMAVWSGGVIVIGLRVLPRLLRQGALATTSHVMGSLSRSATWALALVILSGIYNAYHGLGGTIHPLLHTQWGAVLTLKTTLVTIALALGAANRLVLQRAPTLTPENASTLARLLRLEALDMLAILFISGFLANSPPAAS